MRLDQSGVEDPLQLANRAGDRYEQSVGRSCPYGESGRCQPRPRGPQCFCRRAEPLGQVTSRQITVELRAARSGDRLGELVQGGWVPRAKCHLDRDLDYFIGRTQHGGTVGKRGRTSYEANHRAERTGLTRGRLGGCRGVDRCPEHATGDHHHQRHRPDRSAPYRARPMHRHVASIACLHPWAASPCLISGRRTA